MPGEVVEDLVPRRLRADEHVRGRLEARLVDECPIRHTNAVFIPCPEPSEKHCSQRLAWCRRRRCRAAGSVVQGWHGRCVGAAHSRPGGPTDPLVDPGAFLKRAMGFEPTTLSLGSYCSSSERSGVTGQQWVSELPELIGIGVADRKLIWVNQAI